MEDIYKISYVSSAVYDYSDSDLEHILNLARRRNAAMNLTGVMLYCNGSIFQHIEGNRLFVEAVFSAICRDERHCGIVKVMEKSESHRDFPHWNMGFRYINQAKTSAHIPNFLDGHIREWSNFAPNNSQVISLVDSFLRLTAEPH